MLARVVENPGQRPGSVFAPIHWNDQLPHLDEAEINAIRRAMARLHHPDQGGDSNRMKQWNKLLDEMIDKHRTGN